MITDINLKLLRAFDAVARHRSFTGAAQDLRRAQSTISAQVAELEQQLGVRLLERTSRSVALTEAGDTLADRVRLAFDTIDEGLSAVRDLVGDRRGRVLIACVPSLSGALLPGILARYRERDSTTRIDVEELTSIEMVEAVVRGAIDFGIGPCPDPAPADVAFAPAVEEPLRVVMKSSDARRFGPAIRFGQLTSLQLITLSGSVLLQRLLEEQAGLAGLKLNSRTEVRHIHTAIGMARAGVGAAIVPQLALPETLAADMAALAIVEPSLTRKVGVLTRHGTPLRLPAVRLARFVRTALGRAQPAIGEVSVLEG